MIDTDETLPNGTEFEHDGAKFYIISSDEEFYYVRQTETRGKSYPDRILKRYVHQWHGDYLARGLTTRGGEATGRKSRPVRIVPY